MRAGELRAVSVPHTIQSLIGLTVYPFASGAFGDELLGAGVFSAAEVDRRKLELRNLVRAGLAPLQPDVPCEESTR